MSQVAVLPEQGRSPRQSIEVIDPIPVLDTSRFEHMQRIASVMAKSSLLPESLTMIGKKDDKEPLPFEQVLANAFLVVNQAVRWGLDPFAVAQCVSVVHGKLCYEGKLVAAVIEAKAGIRLKHYLVGEGESRRIYVSDVEFTAEIVSQLKPGVRPLGTRMFDGSVAEWKTTGAGTPWSPKNSDRMLIYRGTRDWTRIYEPALMLGVYTEDEMMDLSDNARASRARPASSMADRLAGARQADAGFSSANVEEEISKAITKAPTSPGADLATATAVEDPATAKTLDQASPEAGDAGAVQDRDSESTAPTQPEPAELMPPVGSAGDEERPAESLPVGLSSDDRELLRFYVEELDAERADYAVEEVRTRFWKGKGLEKGSALAIAAGAITDAHRKRVTGEISIDECDKRCKEAAR